MQGVRRRQLDDPKTLRLKPYDIAGLYALAGENDQAFEWLKRAYKLPLLVGFFTDARFDSLRDDPRFGDLLRKLNLPEDAIQRHLDVAKETP